MKEQSFPKKNRLLRRGAFAHLGKRGRVFSAGGCSGQWMLTERPFVRLGITVSAKCGPSVERNLFKRRVREAFRISPLRHKSNIDINIRPQKPFPITFSEIVSFFSQLNEKIL